ncbi:MAG: hypothetical protein WBF42_04050 [Terracidiphilus sp.]
MARIPAGFAMRAATAGATLSNTAPAASGKITDNPISFATSAGRMANGRWK